MNRFYTGALWGLLMVMLFVLLAVTISADDDGKKHRRRERRHSGDNHHGERYLKPVSNTTYTDQCGDCHFAYQPELLPSKSWRLILDGTDDHFGETLDLGPDARVEISDYLASNAADTSSCELSKKIMKCLAGRIPLRITDIPYILKEHHEVSAQVIKRPAVGSWSNCIACHRTAENGVYDDDWVSIPE